MQPDIIQKYNRPVPRYTSYPPANFFTAMTAEEYLQAVDASNKARQNQISFYLHIPFCRHLCHYCGCNSYPFGEAKTIAAYVDALHQEIDLVARHITSGRKISQIHYGGGSPTSIPVRFIKELNEHLLSLAPVIEKPEIAIECHPGYLTADDWQQLSACGFTRYSLGIQDFQQDVLRAVNRHPPLLPVDEILHILRSSGGTVNMDFIYGLPLQTVDSFRQTIEQAAELQPDRLVTFSYAHLPRLFPRQNALERLGLPTTNEKKQMFEQASQTLLRAGYMPVGLDHFVLPDDELAQALSQGLLHRNFQGYCTRRTTAQVYAFGVTAISQLDNAYAQNGRDIDEYIRTITAGRLYTSRGYCLSEEEKLRREVIETLMCNYALDWTVLAHHFSTTPDDLRAACGYDEQQIQEMAADELLTLETDRIVVSTEGRPFVRNVAAAFDPLVRHTDKKFSNPI